MIIGKDTWPFHTILGLDDLSQLETNYPDTKCHDRI
jgi:hypothetical protein